MDDRQPPSVTLRNNEPIDPQSRVVVVFHEDTKQEFAVKPQESLTVPFGRLHLLFYTPGGPASVAPVAEGDTSPNVALETPSEASSEAPLELTEADLAPVDAATEEAQSV